MVVLLPSFQLLIVSEPAPASIVTFSLPFSIVSSPALAFILT